MGNPALPNWLKFLQEVNFKISEIWISNKREPAAASKVLAVILQNALKGDERSLKWGSNKDITFYIAADEPAVTHIKYSKLLESIVSGKLLISPFTFWSFIFSLKAKYDEHRLGTIVSHIGSMNSVEAIEIAEGLIHGSGCDCKQVIDTYLQHIADHLESIGEWWNLFELFMRDPDSMDDKWQETVNEQIKKFQDLPGIGKEAIPNMLPYIRPELTFLIKKNDGCIADVIKNPAYWNSAPTHYISQIKELPSFSKFGKSDAGKNFYLLYEAKSIYGIFFHYEIIVGKTRKDNTPYKIFTEFHVEPEAEADKKLLEILNKNLAACKSDSISFDYSWRKNGFSMRYGNGIPVLDSNGNGRDFEDVHNDLAEQMDNLYIAINNALEEFLVAAGMNWHLHEKLELLESSRQLILTGAPGTGKTFTAIQMAEELIKRKGGIWKKVQFHPGYDYSDFVIGLKPEVTGKGKVTFKWENGVLKKFADEAKGKAEPYILIIDEINRADLSRVFGEVFSLLEEEYRYPNNAKGITLPNGENFILPDNLYIIGTMNDIDRSVESMDFALRRRFSWYEVKAEDSEHIIDAKKKDSDEYKIPDENVRRKLKDVMRCLNDCISGKDSQLDLQLGDEYQLGGAYFLNFAKYSEDQGNAWENLWNNHIAVILNEYLRGRKERQQLICALRNKYFAILGDDK